MTSSKVEEAVTSRSKDKPKTRVAQIANISPTATREQLYQLFSYVGRISDIKVYPSETNPTFSTCKHKMAFIKFEEYDSVATCQHMTNTVFIDRALICVPVQQNRIPEEDVALKTGGPSFPGQRQLPPSVVNQLQNGQNGLQNILTIDPTLSALGLPAYPPLPANTEASKIEEIRRTIYVGNIPLETEASDLMDFFNKNIGEVMYLRMAGTSDLAVKFCYIEFSHQHTVPTALQNNGLEFNGSKLRIQHSKVAIIKPQAKTEAMAKKEVEEALRQQGTGTGMPGSTTTSQLNTGLRLSGLQAAAAATHSRSRSPRRRRSPSRSRSPSYHRSGGSSRRYRRSSRSRSGSPRRSKRDRSRDKSRDRKRSRSRDRKRSSRRSRSRSGGRSSRRDREKKSERDRDRDRDRDRGKDDKKTSSSSSSKRVKEEKQSSSSKKEDTKPGKNFRHETKVKKEKRSRSPSSASDGERTQKPKPMAGRDDEDQSGGASGDVSTAASASAAASSSGSKLSESMSSSRIPAAGDGDNDDSNSELHPTELAELEIKKVQLLSQIKKEAEKESAAFSKKAIKKEPEDTATKRKIPDNESVSGEEEDDENDSGSGNDSGSDAEARLRAKLKAKLKKRSESPPPAQSSSSRSRRSGHNTSSKSSASRRGDRSPPSRSPSPAVQKSKKSSASGGGSSSKRSSRKDDQRGSSSKTSSSKKDKEKERDRKRKKRSRSHERKKKKEKKRRRRSTSSSGSDSD